MPFMVRRMLPNPPDPLGFTSHGLNPAQDSAIFQLKSCRCLPCMRVQYLLSDVYELAPYKELAHREFRGRASGFPVGGYPASGIAWPRMLESQTETGEIS